MAVPTGSLMRAATLPVRGARRSWPPPGIGMLLASSSFRLALIYMVLFGFSVILLLGFIYWSTAVYMVSQIEETIEAEVSGLAERYRFSGMRGLSDSITQRIARNPGGESVYLLADGDFKPLIGNLDRWPEMPETQSAWLDFMLTVSNSRQGSIERHRARGRHFLLPGDYNLLVGRDVHGLEETKRRIVSTLAWGLAMTVVLALAGGAMMSRSIVRRIDLINQTSREIMSGDLSRRIPGSGTGDDFDQLTANLNRMLDQIQSLMDQVREVSDNIAHDLRTPLTRLRNQLEMMRARETDAEARAEQVDAAIDEADSLLATFNALLRIARVERGDRRAGFAALDMNAVLRDVAEFYEPLAEERGQTLQLRTPEDSVEICGDRDLLFQACANLVDNAIKYTPCTGLVAVSLRSDADCVRIQVADSGAGVPSSSREQVVKRFVRLERSRSTAGNGLGLALVDGVARLHGGRLVLTDADGENADMPGLMATIELPLPRR